MRATCPGRRGRPVLVTVLVLTGTGLVPGGGLLPDGGPWPGGTAVAAPTYPGEDDVAAAREAVGAKAREVGRIQSRLAEAAAVAEAAQTALSSAVEDFNQAQVELDQRTREARLARRQASAARADLETARREVGRIAAEQYRDGGRAGGLDLLLTPGGPEELLDRFALLDVLGERRQRTMQRVEAGRVVADLLDRQADRALGAQRIAAERMETARRAAEARSAAAVRTVADTERQRTGLLADLARLRNTSVQLERERQAGLEAERRAREEAARRQAEAERRAREEAERKAREEAERKAREEAERKAREQAERRDREDAERRDRERQRRDGDGSGGSGDGGGTPTSAGAGARALAWARGRIGLPYQWGADGPRGYDCSGLTMRAWQQAGVSLAHSSRWQYRQVRKVSYDEIRPGDLVFWAAVPGNPDTIHHVALWAGGGRILEAPSTGLTVRITAMRWGGAMPHAGRP